jgi:prepilin-type N-terminal cleavage/methylation domain-containing protein
MKTNKKGFTLIEMLVVIGIIGILSGMILVSVSSVRKNSIDTRRKANVENVRGAISMYYSVKNALPCTFATGDTCTTCSVPGDSSGTNWCKLITKLSASGYLSDNVLTNEDSDDKNDYAVAACTAPCVYRLCNACETNGEGCTVDMGGDTRKWNCLDVK